MIPIVYTLPTVYIQGVSENEIGLREGRAQFGELVSRAEYAGTITYITRHGRRVAAIVPLNVIKESAMTITVTDLANETGATVEDVLALADQLTTLDSSEAVVASEVDGDVTLTAEAASAIREQLGKVVTYARTREGDDLDGWGDDVITMTQRGNEVSETSHVDGIDGKDTSGFSDEYEAAEHIRTRCIDLEADGYARA